MKTWQRHSYVWVTAVLFLVSLIGHWAFGWFAYVDEANEHQETPEVRGYMVDMAPDTFENWQSEFLQLIWQVAGLAFLFYVGSPQSKEGDERKEEKIDAILKAVRKDGDDEVARLDTKYPKN